MVWLGAVYTIRTNPLSKDFFKILGGYEKRLNGRIFDGNRRFFCRYGFGFHAAVTGKYASGFYGNDPGLDIAVYPTGR